MYASTMLFLPMLLLSFFAVPAKTMNEYLENSVLIYKDRNQHNSMAVDYQFRSQEIYSEVSQDNLTENLNFSLEHGFPQGVVREGVLVSEDSDLSSAPSVRIIVPRKAFKQKGLPVHKAHKNSIFDPIQHGHLLHRLVHPDQRVLKLAGSEPFDKESSENEPSGHQSIAGRDRAPSHLKHFHLRSNPHDMPEWSNRLFIRKGNQQEHGDESGDGDHSQMSALYQSNRQNPFFQGYYFDQQEEQIALGKAHKQHSQQTIQFPWADLQTMRGQAAHARKRPVGSAAPKGLSRRLKGILIFLFSVTGFVSLFACATFTVQYRRAAASPQQ